MSGKSSPDIEQISFAADPEPAEKAGVKIEEAAELYGDEKIAQSYGYVARG